MALCLIKWSLDFWLNATLVPPFNQLTSNFLNCGKQVVRCWKKEFIPALWGLRRQAVQRPCATVALRGFWCLETFDGRPCISIGDKSMFKRSCANPPEQAAELERHLVVKYNSVGPVCRKDLDSSLPWRCYRTTFPTPCSTDIRNHRYKSGWAVLTLLLIQLQVHGLSSQVYLGFSSPLMSVRRLSKFQTWCTCSSAFRFNRENNLPFKLWSFFYRRTRQSWWLSPVT